MEVILVISTIVLPIIMYLLQKFSAKFRLIFDITAIVATLVFGNIASLSIYEIIVENMVFMTTIHAIFLNPFFLATGAYMGLYILYRLLLVTMEEWGE